MEPETDEYGIIPTQMRLDPYYIKIYCMWLNFLLMGLGPFVLLITLNTLTLRELKTMAAQISRGPHYGASGPISVTTRKKDLALATVSLAIVFVFIVCHSIKWIPNIYELIQVCLLCEIVSSLLAFYKLPKESFQKKAAPNPIDSTALCTADTL